MIFWWTSFQFLLAFLFIFNFLYFLLAHQRKAVVLGPMPRCAAKDGINHPINITKDTDLRYVTDVGTQFSQLFFAGLILNFVIAFQSLFVCFGERGCVKWAYVFASVTKALDVAFLIGVTALRWSHAGKVCSGDYLYKPVSLESRQEGILVLEGQFLEVYCIVGYIQFFIMVTALFVNNMFVNMSEDKERDN